MAGAASPYIEPIVHDVFAPASQTWQYVVVDPTSNHCVLIDPVMGPTSRSSSVSPADELLAIVKKNNYQVDMIVETHASPMENRSATWSLRMQLRDMQGYAPRVSDSGQAVSGIEKLFARKYGAALQTNLDAELKEGEVVEIGNMSMKVVYLPGLCTPDGRGYEIGMNLFGAYSTADLQARMRRDDFVHQLSTMEEDECHALWESFQKILGMPPDYRLYFDYGEPELSAKPRVRFEDGTHGEPDGKGKQKGVLQTTYMTVAQCRSLNTVSATAAEFMKVWEQVKGRQPLTAPPVEALHAQQITPHGGGEKSAKDGDSVPAKKTSRVGNWFRSSSKKAE